MTGGGKKVFDAPKDSKFMPCVGSYNVRKDIDDFAGAGHFPKYVERKLIDDSTPGVGAYDIDENKYKLRKPTKRYSMGSRHTYGNTF